MTTQYFYDILQSPEKISDLSEIEKLISRYPYFYISQMLYLSYFYQTNDDQFSIALKRFSHNIPNRKFLFQYLKKTKNIPKPAYSEKITEQSISIQNTELKNTPAQTIEDVQKDINKTISESIVQKELLEINPIIKDKAKEHKLQLEQETDKKQTEQIEQKNIHQESESTSNQKAFHGTLSELLKQYTVKHTDLQTNQNNAETQDLKKEKIKQQQEIIDKIISSPPKPSKIGTAQKFYSAENKAKESLLETEDLVTETLAEIYAAQGNIHKAIRSYEILSLKFPQKNTYFAAKIEELKNRLKNK